jgi:hypothetical protein
MADTTPTLDAATQTALEKLADIAVPAPVSWVPQTWGWAVLAAVALAACIWGFVRWRRRRKANRYRLDALAELTKLQDVAGIPALLKRTTLAAWPREQVAALTGAQWVAFLRSSGEVADPLARLLDDSEYRSQLASPTPEEAKQCVQAARRWIEEHRVSA